MADKIEILDQLYEGHTCSNCGKRFDCKNVGPCKDWEEGLVLQMSSHSFKAKPRKLNINWSLAAEENLFNATSLDAEEELLGLSELTTEIMLNELRNKADNT